MTDRGDKEDSSQRDRLELGVGKEKRSTLKAYIKETKARGETKNFLSNLGT